MRCNKATNVLQGTDQWFGQAVSWSWSPSTASADMHKIAKIPFKVKCVIFGLIYGFYIGKSFIYCP